MTEPSPEPLSAPPYTTGGGGVVLEHRYGATLLAALLTGDPVPVLGPDLRPLAIRFQAHGYSPVDDLLVTGRTADGGQRRVSVGVRRAPQLTTSDETSVPLIATFLRVVTDSWDDVQAGRWRLALAVASPSPAVRQVRELAVIAKASVSHAGFRAEVMRPGRTSRDVRRRLGHFDALVSAAVEDEKGNVRPGGASVGELSWRLLSSLQVLELRLEGADQTDQATVAGQLRSVTRDGSAASAAGLFERLENLADEYAPVGAEVTEASLRRDLSGTPLARSPSYHRAWEVLDSLAGRLRDRTGDTLAEDSVRVRLDRRAERQSLSASMVEAGRVPAAVVVSGEPDVGKSALALLTAGQLADEGTPVTVLSLRDLPSTMLELEAVLGAPLTDVLAGMATGNARLLVVDGGEAALEGRGLLLAEIGTAALRAGLGVAAVTRNDGAGAVERALADATAAAGTAGPVRKHEVPRLTAAEVGQVTASFTSVRRLADDPRAAWLLGRPGLIGLLLRAGAAADLPDGPLSEADVFAAVWHHLVRRGEVTGTDGVTPDAREQALLSLALRALLPAGSADPPNPVALPSLRSDGLLMPSGPTSAWLPADQFSGDLIRDLAVARLLITAGWTLLNQAGAPRWALRAARLACQAAVSTAGPASEATRLALERTFNEIAVVHGQRWAEVPVEALLTLSAADDVLARAWPALLAEQHSGLRTLLRLALQRHARHRIGEATVLGPLVALAYCSPVDLGQHDRHDRGTGEQIREVVLAWLRGLVADDAGPVPLRQQVRDTILARDPASHDEWVIEAVGMLGPDLGEDGESLLRGLAEAGGGHLAPAVESAGAAGAMARSNPQLLLALTGRFYILDTGEHDDIRSLYGGIRSHQRARSPTGPLAAWYYGPFWALLNARPADAVALINRMLDHAAAVRASAGQGVAQPGHVPGLDLDLPGVGTRWCAGDDQTWRWYRGGSTGPYPCVSALLAVERLADQLLATGIVPAREVARLLLRDCRNLAMPGLVAGLLIRHQAQAGDLLDGWLSRPEIWQLEAARAAGEGHLHVQGPDPADLPGRDRRRLSFREVAAGMTVQAVLDGDQDRLDVLASIADDLVDHARSLVAGSDDADRELATVQGWAAILHPENHHPRQADDSVIIEYQHPEDVAENLAPVLESLNRGSTAFRLQAAYAIALAEGRALPTESLPRDLAAARDLPDNPPPEGPVWIIDPVAAVAAAAVIAHARGEIEIPAEDLNWSAGILVDVATSKWRHPLDSEYSIYPMGADRSAAAALAALLLMPSVDPGSGTAAVGDALRQCATSLPDEVRIIFARATSSVWAAPCLPAAESGPCRHQLLWDAAMEALRDCRLGDWSQTAQRRLIAPIQDPFGEALDGIPTDRLLLNRLTGPLIAAAAAASSTSCVADAARTMLGALLPAHRRATLHWAAEGYSHPGNQHGPAAARALAELAACGDTEPVIEHARALTSNMGALASFLHDLATEFTYSQSLRSTLAGTWRPMMAAALAELERDPGLLDDYQWSGVALGSLLPGPDLRIEDTSPDATLQRARETWPEPEVFADLVGRWLPVARTQPSAIDGLVRLARCGPPPWQATIGLTWAENLITGRYSAIAHRSYLLPGWLDEIRPAVHHDPEATTRWRRIIDGLASAGDSRAAELQRAEE